MAELTNPNTATFASEHHHTSDVPGSSTWNAGNTYNQNRPVLGKGPVAAAGVQRQTHGADSRYVDRFAFSSRLEAGPNGYLDHAGSTDNKNGFGAATTKFGQKKVSSQHVMGDKVVGAYELSQMQQAAPGYGNNTGNINNEQMSSRYGGARFQ